MRKFLKKIIDWFDLCDHDIKIYKVKYLDFSPRKINGLNFDVYRYVEHSNCQICNKEYEYIRSVNTTKYYTKEGFNKYLNDIIKHNKIIQ